MDWLELSEEDRPPQHIWLSTEKLNEHFQLLNERYKAQGAGQESVPDPEMTENEATKGLRR